MRLPQGCGRPKGLDIGEEKYSPKGAFPNTPLGEAGWSPQWTPNHPCIESLRVAPPPSRLPHHSPCAVQKASRMHSRSECAASRARRQRPPVQSLTSHRLEPTRVCQIDGIRTIWTHAPCKSGLTKGRTPPEKVFGKAPRISVSPFTILLLSGSQSPWVPLRSCRDLQRS